MTITALTVSAQSNDAGKLIYLHPQLKGLSTPLPKPMSDVRDFSKVDVDVVVPGDSA